MKWVNGQSAKYTYTHRHTNDNASQSSSYLKQWKYITLHWSSWRTNGLDDEGNDNDINRRAKARSHYHYQTKRYHSAAQQPIRYIISTGISEDWLPPSKFGGCQPVCSPAELLKNSRTVIGKSSAGVRHSPMDEVIRFWWRCRFFWVFWIVSRYSLRITIMRHTAVDSGLTTISQISAMIWSNIRIQVQALWTIVKIVEKVHFNRWLFSNISAETGLGSGSCSTPNTSE